MRGILSFSVKDMTLDDRIRNLKATGNFKTNGDLLERAISALEKELNFEPMDRQDEKPVI